MDVEGSTRDRLLSAGIRLFAEKGFDGATVGEIEAMAGLQPRRGAMYHYFPTKQALLEAAVENHLVVVERMREQLSTLTGEDIRAEALAMGRAFLDEMEVQRYLVRIVEQDGDRYPAMRDMIRDRLIDTGGRAGEMVLRWWLGPRADTVDVEAFAAILVAPLVNHKRGHWTFGAPPLGLDDDRLLNGWAEACALFADALRQQPAKRKPKSRSNR
jgi:AcrR family transcriptional regulator